MAIVNIAIAEDHLLVRQGLVSMLNTHKDVKVLFDVDSEQILLEQLKQQQVDIVILGVQIPLINSRSTLKILKNKYPRTKVIILSPHYNNGIIIDLISDGISGLLLKNCCFNALVDAIDKVHKKEKYFDSKITELLISKIGNKDMNDLIYKELTARQVEIIKLFYEEKNTEEIAEILFLSRRTIEWHKNKIFEKTGSRNIIGVIKYALSCGLISAE